MIVSASFRTDIPAFYAPWFMRRFDEGFARVANPYGGPPSTVPLRSGVDGFVFWTRNAQPFLPALSMVRAAEIPFVVTFTVTGYPRVLEPSVISSEQAVGQIKEIAGRFGPSAVVWRYDPILFSSLTPPDFHRESFSRLADALAGTVDECQTSVATLYRKSQRNLALAARGSGLEWWDPVDDDKRALIGELDRLAIERGMRLSVCSQAAYVVEGTAPASCVDARRLERVAGNWGLPRAIKAKVKGNRPDCACHESRDIGAYDTCPHGCAYCYAVGSRAQAKRYLAGHDPGAPSMTAASAEKEQPDLFP